MADVDDNDTLLAAEIVRHGRRHQSASIKAFLCVAIQNCAALLVWLYTKRVEVVVVV